MPTLSVTNRTASRLPVSSHVGVLEPNEVRQVELTANELELTRATIMALSDAGHILFTVAASSTNDDNQTEVVLGGAKVLTGTGTPEAAVVGSVGDLYTRKDGGASTTLYVKESGNNTNTGWIAK